MPVHPSALAADLLLAAAATAIVVVLYRRKETVVPPSVVTLVVVALAVAAAPGIHRPSPATVSPVVTASLIMILFDGGLGLGRSAFVASIRPIVGLGLAGTAATAALAALFVHYAVGLPWFTAVLVATALAPTDPAVVFSVVGRNRPGGRSAPIVEGESGANDPIGISLMAGLVGAGSLSTSSWEHVLSVFGRQLGLGLAMGVVGGLAMAAVGRRSAGDGPVPALITAAFLIGMYWVTARIGGSGFLAVFAAGILCCRSELPDGPDGTVFPGPRARRLHSALAGVGEAAAFAALGSTVSPEVVSRADVWVPGLALGAAVALLIRPVVVGLFLWPVRLRRPERVFVALAGLKGAVPILLGGRILSTAVDGRQRAYGIVVVAVAFSVAVLGPLMGPLVARLGLPTDGER